MVRFRLAIGAGPDGWLNDTGLSHPEGLCAGWIAQSTFRFTTRLEHASVHAGLSTCPFTFHFSLPWRFDTCLRPGGPYSSPWSSLSQCACRSFRLPLGSLLSLGLTMHLQALLTRQITFR
jgi:hypothetical protein